MYKTVETLRLSEKLWYHGLEYEIFKITPPPSQGTRWCVSTFDKHGEVKYFWFDKSFRLDLSPSFKRVMQPPDPRIIKQKNDIGMEEEILIVGDERSAIASHERGTSWYLKYMTNDGDVVAAVLLYKGFNDVLVFGTKWVDKGELSGVQR